MAEICGCGLLKVHKVGTSTVEGRVVCNKCGLPLEHSSISYVPTLVDDSMNTTLKTLPGYRITAVHGVVTELSATSGFTASTTLVKLVSVVGTLRVPIRLPDGID
jgi:hypothetical protein